jgi:hypothetical protein
MRSPLQTFPGLRGKLKDGEYVARMEDVLDLYAEAPHPKCLVVCFDESPIQLIGEVRQPIPAEPGQLERYDCEYRRNGPSVGRPRTIQQAHFLH